jgi:hypothetical protein
LLSAQEFEAASAEVDVLDGARMRDHINGESRLCKTGVDSSGKDVYIRYCVLGGARTKCAARNCPQLHTPRTDTLLGRRK